jgi:CBS domain-containing protein
MPTCREIMTTDPARTSPDEPVNRAADLMKREDIGSLPVVESRDSDRLVGIVTDRDLVVKVLAAGRDVESATVRDAMTTNPTAVREDEDAKRAVELMAERQVRRMPVVDAQGRLRGMIAQADIATRLHKDRTTGELVEAISDSGSTRK